MIFYSSPRIQGLNAPIFVSPPVPLLPAIAEVGQWVQGSFRVWALSFGTTTVLKILFKYEFCVNLETYVKDCLSHPLYQMQKVQILYTFRCSTHIWEFVRMWLPALVYRSAPLQVFCKREWSAGNGEDLRKRNTRRPTHHIFLTSNSFSNGRLFV